MTDYCNKEILLQSLVICITFYYDPERITYLRTIIHHYIGIASKTHIYIVTNTSNYKYIELSLVDLPDNIFFEFITPSGIGHPFLLTWTHREILRSVATSGKASHFLYTEDDLLLGYSNIAYWMRYRGVLQKYGLIPSFFRVEINDYKSWVSTDCVSPILFSEQPKLLLEEGTLFMNMPNPYQGLYFLDVPLMEEFINSPAMSPDFGIWKIREKAAQGLTFLNIPEGYHSRNVVPIDLHQKSVSQQAWIHHLPNNYANNKNTPYGKILMEEIFCLEDDIWLEGSFYSIIYDENLFLIIKILKADHYGIHVHAYIKYFDERPMSIDLSIISAEQLKESLEIEYIPFSRSLFSLLDAQFIQQSEVLPTELREYEMWKAEAGNYFG